MRSHFLSIFLVLAATANSQLVINEVCSRNNSVLEDASGDHPDWIEIFNAGDLPIDLDGHFLSDRNDELTKFQLPSIQLAAGEYALFLSGDEGSGGNYFGFGISGEGESIFLSDPALQIIDQINVPLLHADDSYGRTGMGMQFFDQPTPGAINNTAQYSGYTPEPIIAPTSDQHVTGQPILISAPIEGAIIHYTLDGSEPTFESPPYKGTFRSLGRSLRFFARMVRD